jgi:hypothetical protein
MKQQKIVKPRSESKFKLNDKTSIIILLILPFVYFLFFAPGILTGSKMLGGSDRLSGGYASEEIITRELAKYKEIPMWYNYIFGGLPTVAGPYADAGSLYPFLRLLMPSHILFSYIFVLGFVLAGIGMYLFLRSLEISPPAALIGGIAYMFAGNLASMTYAGQGGRLLAAAFFPLAFFFWNKGIITHRFHWFVFTGAITGLSFIQGHFQLTYYGIWLALIFFVVQLIWQRHQNSFKETTKLIGYAIISMVVAVGILAVNYLPILANLGSGARGATMRGYEFASSWSMPPSEIFGIIVAQFNGILDKYWGANQFKLHTEYFGIILILLAVFTIFLKFKERKTIFFFFSGIIGTLIAFGGYTPFYKLIYYLVPGVKRFRAPSLIFFLVAFSTITLGAIGLQYLFDMNQQKKIFDNNTKCKIKRFVYFTLIIFVVFVALFAISKGSIASGIKDSQKLQAFTSNQSAIWNGILVIAVLILVYLFLFNQLANNKIKILTFIVIAVVLMLFDQWRIDRQFIQTAENPKTYYTEDEVINFLKQDTSLYRVYPLYYERSNEGVLDLHNIQNVAGYCPNPLQSYQDFIGASGTVMFQAPNLVYPNFLNLLNVKYIISVPLPEDISKYDLRTQQMIVNMRNFVNRSGIEQAYQGRKYILYRNINVLPRTFLVPNYEVIKNKDEVIGRLMEPDFNPLEIVIIPESINGQFSNSNNANSLKGTAQIVKYTPNRIVVETESNNNCFLVLSENYHPAWSCKVDGNPTEIYNAYHTFRAIPLQTGKHQVEFYYRMKIYNTGRLISVITFLFCFAVLFVFIRNEKKAKHIKQS